MTEKYLVCEKCGKRLLEKHTDGMLTFCFGKNENTSIAPVEMNVYGSIEIKCIRKSCNHWNVFNHFGR